MSDIGKALGQKNGHTELALLAAQYRKAEERFQECSNADSLRRAQITVARANGDEEMVRKLESDFPKGFVDAYNARKDAAKRLCEAMSINPNELRWALS